MIAALAIRFRIICCILSVLHLVLSLRQLFLHPLPRFLPSLHHHFHPIRHFHQQCPINTSSQLRCDAYPTRFNPFRTMSALQTMLLIIRISQHRLRRRHRWTVIVRTILSILHFLVKVPPKCNPHLRLLSDIVLCSHLPLNIIIFLKPPPHLLHQCYLLALVLGISIARIQAHSLKPVALLRLQLYPCYLVPISIFPLHPRHRNNKICNLIPVAAAVTM